MDTPTGPGALALDLVGLRLQAGRDGDFTLDIPALRLAAGDALAITGASGSGKSTLLEFLALLRQPTALKHFAINTGQGEMRDVAPDLLAGRTDALARLRAGPIGYVPQMGGVLPFLPARAHAEAGLRLAGLAEDPSAWDRFDRLAGRLGLQQHMGKTREALSGGQRKRVSLLAGLSVKRRLLLADEPTAGLDDRLARSALELLVEIARSEKTAVLIATHDAEAAQRAGFAVSSLTDGAFHAATSEVV